MGVLTLDEIRRDAVADRYPTSVLEGCETALVLFAAGFHGKQDAIWMAEAGITATCVDTDHAKLGEMILAYPEGWEYVYGDAFEYAEQTERQWDVVSLDPFTNLIDRCAELLPLWCSLARRVVVLGTGTGAALEAPDGWAFTDEVQRSSFNGGVYWTVLKRC